MELVLIKIDSNEWNFMWGWLGQHPMNNVLNDPEIAFNNGEEWQYMGSYRQGDRMLHEFRHRNHPYNNSLQQLSVSASAEVSDDDIEKVIPVR